MFSIKIPINQVIKIKFVTSLAVIVIILTPKGQFKAVSKSSVMWTDGGRRKKIKQYGF